MHISVRALVKIQIESTEVTQNYDFRNHRETLSKKVLIFRGWNDRLQLAVVNLLPPS